MQRTWEMSTPSGGGNAIRRMPPISGGSPEGDDPDPEPTPAQLDPPAEAAVPPAVDNVSRADFDRVIRENSENFQRALDQQRQMFESALSGQRRASEPAPQGVLTDDQIEEKVQSGEWSQTKATSYISKRDLAQFQAQHVDPMRSVGSSAFADQARTTMMLMTDEDGKPAYPHFKRYEKEIDVMIKNFPAGTIITREALDGVYRYVVGGHQKELEKETHERAVRQATAPKPEPVSAGGRSGRTHGKPEEADVTDQFKGYDRDQLAGYLAKDKGGRSLDDQARRMGYKDWRAYEDMAAKLDAAEAN